MIKIRFYIVFTLVFISHGISLSQDTNLVLKDIREKYKFIKNNMQSYDTASIQLWDESTDGGRATAFYDNKSLKLIKVFYFGETGKTQIEYYFNNDKLFFAFEKASRYNRPYYWDKKHMQENNDSVIYDQNKTIVIEDRYYFNDEKLILWINNENEKPDLTLGTNTIVGQGLISHAYHIKSKLKN